MQKIFHNLKRLVNHFYKSEDGAVAMIYGPMAIVLLLAAGISIDYARGYLVKKEIARALDAAVLAAGSLPVTDEVAMITIAKQYFDANISASTRKDYDPQINVVVNNEEVTATSSAIVPTILMKLAGNDTMDINEKSVVGRTLVNIEVALVLDNTGSMSGSKMSSLKTAAKTLVDTLYATDGSSEYVEIALVPFTGAVNIGTDNKYASWVDSESKSVAGQEDYGENQDYPWKTSLKGKTAYEVLDEYDRNWLGCVRARVGTGLTAEGTTVDLDLWDVPPSDSDVNTKWAPYVKPIHTLNGYNPVYNSWVKNVLKFKSTCPAAEILPLTNQKNTIKNQVDSMVASGYTSVPIGLIWGWRVLSSAEPYTEGDDENNTENRKVIVLLTDGQNHHGYYNNGIYSAYGMPNYNHLGTGWLGNQLDDKLETICTNVKSQDILIYSITFQLNDSNTQQLMRECATREDMYFNSPDGSSLQEAFNQIATGLQKLRLKQ
jgi:Flp pilus assembly protein TadG